MEYWDLYDAKRRPLGKTMVRNDWPMCRGEFHLSVLGVIRRPDGRFLISRRAMDKDWAPGWWEVPGGGVMAGESSAQAVCREVKEETGLDVRPEECRLILSYCREDGHQGNNYIVDCYRIDKDFDADDVAIQQEEATGFQLASLDKIKALAEKGIFLHYDSIQKAFEDE